ncbi:MFS general substrate transporter [Meredithblackwellia eburnea MCA 4105]
MASNERTSLLENVPVNRTASPEHLEPLKDTFNSLDPLHLSPATRNGILAGIWLASFLANLNMTLVATLLTSISSEFNSANQASWLGTSYLLATATFTPLYGRLCNILGRRGANSAAVGFLFLGTIGCGLAPSMKWLILARFVAGCGGGGISTTASVITGDLFTLRERGLTQGIASIFSALGMGLGGPLGGWLSEHYGWRSSFFLQIPLFIVSFALTQTHLRYQVLGKLRSPREIIRRIDYLGSLGLFTMVLSSIVGLSLKYNEDYPWSSSKVILCVVGTVAGLAFFIVVELLWAVEPVLPIWMLTLRIPFIVGISTIFIPLCNFAITYFFPLWFEVVGGQSTTKAGAHLFPNSVFSSLGSLFAGYMMNRTGTYKTLNLVFGILPFAATLLINQISVDSGFVTEWLSIVPLGFGNAVVLQTTLIAVLASIPQEHMALGTAFVQLFRGVGQVTGVSVPSAIFQHHLKKQLTARLNGPDALELVAQIRHNSQLVRDLAPALQAEAREAFRISLHNVFIFASACTGMAFILRLWLPEQSLDSPQDDDSDIESDLGENTEVEAALLADPSGGGAPLLAPTTTNDTPPAVPVRVRPRRLSTYQSDDGDDPEPDLAPRSYRSTTSIRGLRSQGSRIFGSYQSGGGVRAPAVEEHEDET